jgi:hypothetical protein
MATNTPFTPMGATVSVTPTTSSAALALTDPGATGGCAQRIYNGTDVAVLINFGASTAEAAVATSMPVPSGAIEVIQLGPRVTHVAHIIAAGSATGKIYFTPGEGV